MKFIWVLILLLILAGVGALALRSTSSPVPTPEILDESETNSVNLDNNDTSAQGETNDAMGKSSGSYIPFTPQVLTNSAGTRRVLYFYANWCPTCRPADKNFSDNVSSLPDDVTLIRVNYGDSETDQAEKDLATKYGVTYQHTFVQIDSNGEVVTLWNGGQIEDLLDNLQ